MFKKENITIPNILSVSRFIFLPLLFYFVIKDFRLAFLIGFIILGLTDYFDGLIARYLNQTSELGTKLDSFADIFFYVSSAYFMAKLYPEYLDPNKTMLFIFFGILALSFIISAIKLKQPMMLHTIILKLNGILVFLLIIISHFFDTTILVTVILSIYFVGFTESIIIFLKYNEVDPDMKSLFHRIKEDKEVK